MRAKRRGLIAGAALAAMLCAVTTTAQAQSQGDPTTPGEQLPTPTPLTTLGGDTPSAAAPQATGADSDRFKQLNNLVLKGWATPVPNFDDTLTQDYGGWRSALASAGFGFTVFSLNLGDYDMAQAGRNLSGPQVYNGEKFTYQTSNQTPVLTYDLSRIGLQGGQLIAIAAVSLNGYQSRDGLDGLRLKGLYWYQPIDDGKVELEMGIISNATDYMGTSVGGSLSGGALGPQASIPSEAGLSYGQYGAPTISARVNWTKHFYTRTGVQRSISPHGSTTEAAYNPTGFTFRTPDANPLVIEEAGYRIAASPGVKALWIRTDGLYNTSDYTSYTDNRVHNNSMLYAGADRQFTQPSSFHPASGVYAGATFESSPGSLNLIYRYFEARVYVRGPFASRPNDMASAVAAINVYSPEGLAATKIGGFSPFTTTQSYTASYSYRITHGLYIQPGVSAVIHPIYNRNTGAAVNALLGLVAFF